jgi:hypothetical protein
MDSPGSSYRTFVEHSDVDHCQRLDGAAGGTIGWHLRPEERLWTLAKYLSALEWWYRTISSVVMWDG